MGVESDFFKGIVKLDSKVDEGMNERDGRTLLAKKYKFKIHIIRNTKNGEQ